MTISCARIAEKMDKGALFSSDQVYRYVLWRRWGAGPYITFVGLNPSTADAHNDDPTIRRCINFAKDWGHAGIYMLNAFAFRATDPKMMKAAASPIGPENDEFIERYHALCICTIACWGTHGDFMNRANAVRLMLEAQGGLYNLGLTKRGHPKHPLYLRKDTKPQLWI